MKAQFENKAMSSFLLYVDNKILDKGEAYTNVSSGSLYPVSNQYNGVFTYAAAFKQLVADTSITGANSLSGVYQNGLFYATGVAGAKLHSINHYEGQFYFTENKSSYTLNADFAVKDFNVYLTSKSEEELLFETKFHHKPKVTENQSGLEPHQQTYPAIFLKNFGGTNEPFAFGGLDNTIIDIRAIILGDSAFSVDAACSIFKDAVRTKVPIIEQANIPLNAVGGSASGYNYTDLTETSTNSLFIEKVTISKNVGSNYAENINPGIYSAFADFELQIPRHPRV